MMYLGTDKAIKVEKLDIRSHVDNFLSMAGSSNSVPDVVIVTLSDFGGHELAQLQRHKKYKNRNNI